MIVQTKGKNVFVRAQNHYLAKSSVVRVRPDHLCVKGIGVELISQPYYYQRDKLVAPNERVCLRKKHLNPLQSLHFISLKPDHENEYLGWVAGQVLPKLIDDKNCDADMYRFLGGIEIPVENMTWIRPLSTSMLERTIYYQEQWAKAYGESILGRVWVSDWGYLALPLQHIYSSNELAEQYDSESLRTSEQQFKAITSAGPSFLHFLGKDRQFSDIWGQPQVIEKILRLSQAWKEFCLSSFESVERCTIKLGDVAWFNDRYPDPLGHKEHRKGNCIDIRLFRTDTSIYEAIYNKEDDRVGEFGGYDKWLNPQFVTFAAYSQMVTHMYFNAPNLMWVSPVEGHDDHIHLCFALY